MNKHLHHRMTVDPFLDWYEEQPNGKRYELVTDVTIRVKPRASAAGLAHECVALCKALWLREAPQGQVLKNFTTFS